MKFLIALAAVLAISSAQFNKYGAQSARLPLQRAPPPPPLIVDVSGPATVLRYDNEVGPDGSYGYAFDIDNGISAQAQGTLRNLGGNPPATAVVADGSFGWTSPEGQRIRITYTADENGYRPSGDAIPTSPPVPEAIARAIEYIAKYGQKKK